MKIAALGDLHVQIHQESRHKELFAEISRHADVLLLCGDLTDTGLPAEAELLAEDLAACAIPVCGLLGNHDFQNDATDAIRNILYGAHMHFLDSEPFVLNDIGFVGVKGFIGGFGNHMLAAFGEPAIKHFVGESVNEMLKLEHLLQTQEHRRIVTVLHYAPIEATVTGEPRELYPFLGSARFAETIDRFPVEVVFHGHAHYGAHAGSTAKGIPVFNVATDVLQREGKKYLLHIL